MACIVTDDDVNGSPPLLEVILMRMLHEHGKTLRSLDDSQGVHERKSSLHGPAETGSAELDSCLVLALRGRMPLSRWLMTHWIRQDKETNVRLRKRFSKSATFPASRKAIISFLVTESLEKVVS